MNFCWVIYCVLANFLALNRYVSLAHPNKLNTMFSKRNTQIMLASKFEKIVLKYA